MDWLIVWPGMDWLTNWWMDWLTSSWMGWLTNWWMGWLTSWTFDGWVDCVQSGVGAHEISISAHQWPGVQLLHHWTSALQVSLTLSSCLSAVLGPTRSLSVEGHSFRLSHQMNKITFLCSLQHLWLIWFVVSVSQGWEGLILSELGFSWCNVCDVFWGIWSSLLFTSRFFHILSSHEIASILDCV